MTRLTADRAARETTVYPDWAWCCAQVIDAYNVDRFRTPPPPKFRLTSVLWTQLGCKAA